MQLVIGSDLHLEWMQSVDNGLNLIDDLCHKAHNDGASYYDILILAGDCFKLKDVPETLAYFTRFKQYFETIIFVPGNHEFYGASISEGIQLCSQIFGDSYLNDTCLRPINNGLYIAGDTLWFPHDPLHVMFHKNYNDFDHIINFGFTVYEENERDVNSLTQYTNENSIVVTHFLPAFESIPEKWRGHILNRFFYTDMTNVILDNKPKLWIHGHSHDPVDYIIGDTRIVSNPRGRPGEFPDRDYSFKIIEV